MPWFQNEYHCPDCDVSWSDEWSAMCDDECPECGADYSPERSEELPSEDCEKFQGVGATYPVRNGRKFFVECFHCDGHGCDPT